MERAQICRRRRRRRRRAQVSLYQILPKRPTTTPTKPAAWPQLADRKRQEARQEAEFPLRLLDIRRIDLNSNGWETFYVKRAVEDWLQDARLNLGEFSFRLLLEWPCRPRQG